MNYKYIQRFDAMEPGTIIDLASIKDQRLVPEIKEAAKQYIDQTGLLEFNPDMTRIKRLEAFAKLTEI